MDEGDQGKASAISKVRYQHSSITRVLMEGWGTVDRVEWNLKHKGRDKGLWVDSC